MGNCSTDANSKYIKYCECGDVEKIREKIHDAENINFNEGLRIFIENFNDVKKIDQFLSLDINMNRQFILSEYVILKCISDKNTSIIKYVLERNNIKIKYYLDQDTETLAIKMFEIAVEKTDRGLLEILYKNSIFKLSETNTLKCFNTLFESCDVHIAFNGYHKFMGHFKDNKIDIPDDTFDRIFIKCCEFPSSTIPIKVLIHSECVISSIAVNKGLQIALEDNRTYNDTRNKIFCGHVTFHYSKRYYSNHDYTEKDTLGDPSIIYGVHGQSVICSIIEKYYDIIDFDNLNGLLVDFFNRDGAQLLRNLYFDRQKYCDGSKLVTIIKSIKERYPEKEEDIERTYFI